MFVIWRSSTRITSKRPAMSVDGLLGPVLAPVRSAGLQPGDGAPDPRAAVRAAPSPGRACAPAAAAACARGADRPGQCSSSPVDRAADTATPRSMPTASPVPGRGHRLRDDGERDMPAPGPVPGHPERLRVLRHLPGPAEPHPARPSGRAPHRCCGSAGAHRRGFERGRCGTPRPGRPCATTGGGASRRRSSAMAWSWSRMACCWTITLPAASHGLCRPGLGELTAAPGEPRHLRPRPAASAIPAPRTGSTRTGRARSGPAAAASWAAEGRSRYRDMRPR